MVMGPPGAGKSTLARQLGAFFGLPVFHLDQVWWRPGWIEAPPDAFRADVERIAALPAWVIDGNFTATIVPRLCAADTLIEELHRTGGRYGLATLCVGGGMGIATVVEAI